jgi:4-hydroxybenzoate polyprenyltransferase
MSLSDNDPARFRRFLALRRRWFRIAFAATFAAGTWLANRKFDSLVEIVGFALFGALLAASILSLAGIPVVWRMSGRRRSSVASSVGGGLE